MASVQKFTSASMIQMLRHNNRSIKEPSNTSIDNARSHLNYSFPLNHHGLSDYRYYQNLVGENICMDVEAPEKKRLSPAVAGS